MMNDAKSDRLARDVDTWIRECPHEVDEVWRRFEQRYHADPDYALAAAALDAYVGPPSWVRVSRAREAARFAAL